MNYEEERIPAVEKKWRLIQRRISQSDEEISDYLDAHITPLKPMIPTKRYLKPRQEVLRRRSKTVHDWPSSRTGVTYEILDFNDNYRIESDFLREYLTHYMRVDNFNEFCARPRIETYFKLCRMLSPYDCSFAERQLTDALCFLSSNNSPDSELVVEIVKNIELHFQDITTLNVDNSVLEYVFHHAKKLNFDSLISRSISKLGTLYESIFTKTVDRVATLLNYGLQRKYTDTLMYRYVLILDLKLFREERRWDDFLTILMRDERNNPPFESLDIECNRSGRRDILALETLSILIARKLHEIRQVTIQWRSGLHPMHLPLLRPSGMPGLSSSSPFCAKVPSRMVCEAYMDINGKLIDGERIRMKRSDAPEMVNLIWRSVPEPFVSHVEMHSILERLLPSRHLGKLEALCAAYRDSGCEGSDAPAAPRSLLHLCRCEIRDCLLQNHQLPEGIEGLKLPEHLKPYLLLKL